MFITDKVQLGKRVTDSNGFVSAPAIITRVGIQKYSADELRRDPVLRQKLDGVKGLVSVFRPPETVFNPLTIDSFMNKPVTINHPNGGVNTKNAKYISGGHVGSDVQKIDDHNLGCTIHLIDCDTIDFSKGVETSAGYECPIIADSGEYLGEKYDYRFDGPMIGNHLALVPAGRCGPECKVLDKKESNPMEKEEVKDLVKDQIEKNVPSAVSAAIKSDDFMQVLTTAIAGAVTAQFAAKEVADKATADAKVKTDAEVKADADAKAKSVALHAKVLPLLGDKYDASKSDHELMVATLIDSIPDADKKSDEYLSDKIDDLVSERKGVVFSKTDAVAVRKISTSAFGRKKR